MGGTSAERSKKNEKESEGMSGLVVLVVFLGR